MSRTQTVGKFQCRACEHSKSLVTDARWSEEKSVFKRRRKCLRCGDVYTTYEIRADRCTVAR